MSGVFQNIDTPPGAGGGHTRRVERGVGGGRRQTQLCRYSTYVSTLWLYLSLPVSWYKTNARTLPWRTTAKTEKVGTVLVLKIKRKSHGIFLRGLRICIQKCRIKKKFEFGSAMLGGGG
jgi:hypothetical protein